MANRRRRGRHKKTSLTLLELIILTILLLLLASSVLHILWLPILLVALALITGSAFLWRRLQKYSRILRRTRTIDDLLLLSPTEFELAVGELLRGQGYYDVRHTGGSGDLAADLTCMSPQGQRVVVQCKRFAPGYKVGSPYVQTFIGMITIHHQAEIGLFVTTSSFTQPALTLARQHNIQVIDGMQLAHMLLQRQLPSQGMRR